jgi:hypothetical protein
VVVRINGRRVARGGYYAFGQVPPGVWRVGANTIVVRATKRRTERCNRGRRGLQLGVEATVGGDRRYGADVEVHRPTARQSGARLELTFPIEQHGPSGLVAGEFQVSVSFTGDIRMLVERITSGLAGVECGTTGPNDGSQGGEQVVCDLPLVPAGTAYAITLSVVVASPPGSFRERGTITWLGSGWRDFTAGNAGQTQGSICSADQDPC